MPFSVGPPKNERKFKSVVPQKNVKIFKGNYENAVQTLMNKLIAEIKDKDYPKDISLKRINPTEIPIQEEEKKQEMFLLPLPKTDDKEDTSSDSIDNDDAVSIKSEISLLSHQEINELIFQNDLELPNIPMKNLIFLEKKCSENKRLLTG